MTETNTTHITISARVRDKHSKHLNLLATKCGKIYNFLNATQEKYYYDRSHKELKERFLRKFDMIRLTTGTPHTLNIISDMVGACCTWYHNARKRGGKYRTRYRNKKSLGFVPFAGRMILETGKKFVRISDRSAPQKGLIIELLEVLKLPKNAKIVDGSCFSENSLGNWYVNITVEIPIREHVFQSECVGGDLGLKTMVTLATPAGNNREINAPMPNKKYGEKLKLIDSRIAKGENKNGTKSKKLVRQRQKLNQKLANIRQHHNHVHSKRITDAYRIIKIGNISVKWLISMGHGMARNASDIALADFKQKLAYKSVRNGGMFYEVNEAFTTQTCSNCGTLPDERPRGTAGLGIREWTCGNCGRHHLRDVNAAINISRVKSDPPVGGTTRPLAA